MNTGTKRLLIAILTSYTVLFAVVLFLKKPVVIVFFAVLGFFVGPFMGIAFPFETMFKIGYILGLFASLACMVFGFKNREHIIGQAAFTIGFIGWSFCGLIGLGTGT